jgi:hypothetical protein
LPFGTPSCHAAGEKRKMPGVRGQRPRSDGFAVQRKRSDSLSLRALCASVVEVPQRGCPYSLPDKGLRNIQQQHIFGYLS